MNEQPSGSEIEFQPLANSESVYRALLRKQWINEDTGLVESEAYYLRKDKNERGLSVSLASVFTPEQCAARFKKCYGVARLEVAHIRELGLDVIPDSISHAEIVHLPYAEDDAEQADFLADSLLFKPQILPLAKHRNPHQFPHSIDAPYQQDAYQNELRERSHCDNKSHKQSPNHNACTTLLKAAILVEVVPKQILCNLLNESNLLLENLPSNHYAFF